MHREVLQVRGEGLLTALEAGIRSHRRMGAWFQENIESVLLETSSSPGILGLAAYRKDGTALATVGEATESMRPTGTHEWLEEGLLIGIPVSISVETDRQGQGYGQGRGRGWRWREQAQGVTGEAAMEREFVLSILLDDTDVRNAICLDLRRFVISLVIAWLAILFGLYALLLHRRKSLLSEALGLAREKAQHLYELNRLAAGLAHETKNPLNLIRGMAQFCLHRSAGDDPIHDTARRIIDESDRLVGRINGFLTYSRPKSADMKEVDMDELVNQIASLFRDEAESKGVSVLLKIDQTKVLADKEMVRQILVNLLTNSFAATGRGGTVTVSLHHDATRGAILEVHDSGDGIQPEDLPHLCDPYFTRRQGGTGLGLSIVKQLVEAQGWRMTIKSNPGNGTQVCIEDLVTAGTR